MEVRRARGIVVEGSELIAMYRNKNGEEYYVFPGGGLENETPEKAVKREVHEETGLHVLIHRAIYDLIGSDGQREQFFLCTPVGGELGTGTGPEFTSAAYADRGQYKVTRIPLANLANYRLLPLQVRDALITDLKAASEATAIPYRHL